MHTQTESINPNQLAPRFQHSQNVARTMSSREIATLTGKRHNNVKRDILAMLTELKADVLSFEHTYFDGQNRAQVEYRLDREHTDCLLTNYSAALRMTVIRRWHELERQAPQIPQTLPEALRLAADLADQNNTLRLVMQEQQPKVDALARIAASNGTMCLTDAAKQLGVRRVALIQWMKEHRWIYRREGCAHWLAYQPRQQNGLLDHKVTVIGVQENGDSRLASQVRVTPRGLALLAEKITGVSL